MDPDLKDFSISTWYNEFHAVTLDTQIINIPTKVVNLIIYGLNDPEHFESSSKLDHFNSMLKNAIVRCGGTAFVKNNWHAPKDAKWISLCNDLKVNNPKDILLYLSASDVIINDFCKPTKDIQFCIALKPWISFHPATEFRCIVINNFLYGITPRDWPIYYKHFINEGTDIIHDIKTFFIDYIKNKFRRPNFLFDVVIRYPRTVLLLDFNPLYENSELHAFNWNEIKCINDKEQYEEVDPVFRYLDTDIGIMSHAEAVHKFLKGYPEYSSEKS